MFRKFFCKILVLMLFLSVSEVFATSYDELRAVEIERCQAIDSLEAQSGLFFNPEGYRSFYVRSVCFQEAAIKLRDESLCSQVRQRFSLFSSSWGYSMAHCKKLLQSALTSDREAINKEKQSYERGAVQLMDFKIVPNGNGRDFDIIPVLKSGYAHGYHLEFTLIDTEDSNTSVLLNSSWFYLGQNNNIRIYVIHSDILKRFPAFVLNKLYIVVGTLTFDVGSPHMNDSFIQKMWPKHERLQSLEKTIRFRSK